MDDRTFTEGFIFRTITFDRYHYTDNRAGAPHHYLARMLTGHCRLVGIQETVEVEAGEVFYIPRGCSYQSYWYGEPEVRFISLGFLCLPNFEKKTYTLQVMPAHSEALALFDALTTAYPTTARDIGLFYTLAGELLPAMADRPQGRAEAIVQQTRTHLLAHPHATPAELAQMCAVSTASLYAAFQHASGLTLQQLRQQLLLDKARELLLSSDCPIETISDQLGYSSPSYFRKKFYQQFHTTPRAMRRAHRI